VLLGFPGIEEKKMAIGGILIILGIVLGLIYNWWIGIILIVLGLVFGGFRRGRWY